MKKKERVFLGLGGNVGNVAANFDKALGLLKRSSSIVDLRASRYYRTSPVSSITQDDFLNACCTFETDLKPAALFRLTQEIEKVIGKVPKEKEAPRVIDIDIIFFGCSRYRDEEIEIPHPKWSERLFVLRPLSDLATHIFVPDLLRGSSFEINLQNFLSTFPNPHHEKVVPYEFIVT